MTAGDRFWIVFTMVVGWLVLPGILSYFLARELPRGQRLACVIWCFIPTIGLILGPVFWACKRNNLVFWQWLALLFVLSFLPFGSVIWLAMFFLRLKKAREEGRKTRAGDWV